VRLDGALGLGALAGRYFQVVLDPHPRDADDTVDVLDVAFDLGPQLVRL